MITGKQHWKQNQYININFIIIRKLKKYQHKYWSNSHQFDWAKLIWYDMIWSIDKQNQKKFQRNIFASPFFWSRFNMESTIFMIFYLFIWIYPPSFDYQSTESATRRLNILTLCRLFHCIHTHKHTYRSR